MLLDELKEEVDDFLTRSSYFCQLHNLTPEVASTIFFGKTKDQEQFHPFSMHKLNPALDITNPSDSIFSHSLLFDRNYFITKNIRNPREGLIEMSHFVSENEWMYFSPLLTQEDFERSGFEDLGEWISLLNDPNTSLSAHKFDRFSPNYYAKTARERLVKNELLDFLYNKSSKSGTAHVFSDNWYAAQQHKNIDNLPEDKLWVSFLRSNSNFRDNTSPFYEPLKCNHLIAQRFGAKTQFHVLDRFIHQPTPAVSPHTEIVPNALAYSFLDRSVESLLTSPVTADDIIAALEEAMTFECGAPKKSKLSPANQSVGLSVCLLNYRKPTFSALAALAAARNSAADTEILVLDNGSNAKDFSIISRLTAHCPKIKVFRSPINTYFGEGNNLLLDKAQGQFVLFLNNDAFVGPKTIPAMVSHLQKNKKTTAVGVTFLYPDLQIQEAGGVVTDCGHQIQLRKNTPLAAHIDSVKGIVSEKRDYISSACFCVRKEALNKLGGYDFTYEPLYYEDTDLCRRITSSKRRIDYLPNDYVIHYENATTKDFLGEGFNPLIAQNRQKFSERWLNKPLGYVPRTMNQAFIEDWKPKRPTALVYTPYGINIGGGERYILSVALSLSTDYNVILAMPLPCSRTRASFVMDELGLSSSIDSVIRIMYYEDAVASMDIDLMIAMGNQAIPPVRFYGKRNFYHCQFPFALHHDDIWEADRLGNVDGILVNSEFTKSVMEKELAALRHNLPVHVTYAPVEAIPVASTRAKQNAPSTIGILNIGRFDPDGHSKRQDVVISIFKTVAEKDPNFTLTLVGGTGGVKKREDYLDTLRTDTGGIDVTFLPNASRERLRTALASNDLYIHACGYSYSSTFFPEKQEHFGISIVEAMSAGLVPIVYNDGGPAEIVKTTGVGYTYNTIEEAAACVIAYNKTSDEEKQIMRDKAIKGSAFYQDKKFSTRLRKILA